MVCARFLSEKEDVIEKNALRELRHANATKKPVPKKQPEADPLLGPTTRGGGRAPKGKKKDRNPRRTDWGKQNNWTRADWGAKRAAQKPPQQPPANTTPTTDPHPAATKKEQRGAAGDNGAQRMMRFLPMVESKGPLLKGAPI